MSSTTPDSAMEAAFGEHIELDDPAQVAALFDQAAEANRNTPGQSGSVVDLPDQGRLTMTGDLHDHPLNLQRILKYAELEQSPANYVVLHEVVHGSSLVNGQDLSIRTTARVAALKAAYPGQVLLLQSNHELAQRNGDRILKGSKDVVETFDSGLDFLFEDQADTVRAAFNRYVETLPLAVRAPNGVMCCHSLPSPRHMESFDLTVLDRQPTEKDLASGGAAYRMVWGRNHHQMMANELGEEWGASQFVMGHQPAESGYDTEGETMLILASDHDQGMLLPIDLSQRLDRDGLIQSLVPLASIARR
jgi:hypothetical protein